MRRLILKALAAIVALVAIVLVTGYAYLRRSLPVVDGQTVVQGIAAPVEIIRDADAIPHIFASSKADALFGLGYAHAQDRLWQMEFQRRIGHGRLSELFGPATLAQDRFLRTVGFGRAARAAWASTPPWAQQQITAYVAGINAFLSTHHAGALPPEFSLLRFEPEPWTGADVVVWVKMMAWDLSANYSFELLRHDLIRAVGEERMAQLMPPYATDGLSIVPAPSGESGGAGGAGGAPYQPYPPHQPYPPYLTSFTRALSTGEPSVTAFLLGSARSEALGSNNWVVDGTLTASGKPLLANDPHLGTRLPSTWYLAHMSAGDFDVIGATLPGAPAVALGRNRHIAWGATNVAADVEDLYRERLDATGTRAEFRGAMEPVTVIRETIRVKGAQPVHVDVRVTRHGPLVSDAINATPPTRAPKPPPLEPLAFRWTALDSDDSTIQSFLKVNEAHNWDEFTGALRDFVVPSQNFVYADVDGHIGYYAPGRIPIRASGDGSRPADGWSGDAEWTGWIPFDALPHLYDPPDHFIVTANHRPEPAAYRYTLGLDWPEPYRAQRIIDLLSSVRLDADRDPHRVRAKFTPADFARMQADTVSLHATALLPVLLAHAHPETAPDRQAADMLRQWNLDATADSAATAIFEAWFHQLAPTVAGDDLGPAVLASYQSRFTFITRFIVNALAANAAWCDDVTTEKRETCDDAVTGALHKGVIDMTRRLGGDMARWRWGAVHVAVFPHQGLDAVAALRPFLSRSVSNGGDWSTVNVGPVAADTPFEQHSVAGYREIIDLSPANDSRFLNDVGVSGHPLSKHYDDFLADWRAVRHRRMRMERADIEKNAIGRLMLTPRR
jgi:penicillin G amidase